MMHDNTALEHIALVGVGHMGHGIARNILRGGYSLHYLAHTGNQPDADLLALGAQRHEDYASLCRRCQCVLLCVTGSAEVEKILSPQGLLPHIRHGSIIIDHSTGTPEKTLALLAQLEPYAIRYLDAPMTKTPTQAEEGTLNLLLGAQEGQWQEILPLLHCYASEISFVGNTGDGQRVKLLHNFVSIGTAILMAEAAAVARTQNIAAPMLYQVLQQGGGRGAILERLKPMLLEGDPSGFQFSINNAAKDLGYYHVMAQALLPRSSLSGPLRQLLSTIEQHCPAQTLPMLIDLLANHTDNETH